MPRSAIKDEFTALPISRQRKYQLRKGKQGLCSLGGNPAASGGRCLSHLVQQREAMAEDGLNCGFHPCLLPAGASSSQKHRKALKEPREQWGTVSGVFKQLWREQYV
jgi:hypothetical protein